MHPLIFIPKVRNIKKVVSSWDHLPYDILVVENIREVEAYHFARNYFLLRKEYTHLVICPDDLIIDHDAFESLKRNVEEYGLSNLSGIANRQQDFPDEYCTQDITKVDYNYVNGASTPYYNKEDIPSEIFSAGFTGFCCQWISRELMSKVTFNGSSSHNNCLDWQFAREVYALNIPLLVSPTSLFRHLSLEQRQDLRQWKLGNQTRESLVYMLDANRGDDCK